MQLAKAKRIVVRIVDQRKLEIGFQNGGIIKNMGTIYPNGMEAGIVFLNILNEIADNRGMEFSTEEWNS